MQYRAATDFVDLQDGRWLYHAGDPFPRDGHPVSEARLRQLAGSNNLAKRPLIAAQPEEKPEEKPEKPQRARRTTGKRVEK